MADDTELRPTRVQDGAASTGQPTRKRGRSTGGPKSGGRKAGTPNKVTREFRAVVNRLLHDNAENVSMWLQEVAEGSPKSGRPPDPARALDLLIKLAEYAAPKLHRIEHIAEDGEPLKPTVIEIEFVDSKAPTAVSEPDIKRMH